MSYCQKCGSEVKEDMTFCPKCGAALKVTEPRPPERYRTEKAEKQEKHEKQEKEEKMEKGEQPEKFEKKEYSVLGPLIGGSILILVGFMFYLATAGVLNLRSIFPFFLIIIGAIVILGVTIGAVRAREKHPRP
ncbi:MAG: zinc-ribbon domain-containing protein [Candidatus Bathyarchaeota archaeon]|jgi:uncharacterized membrane protein YvbJ|nr:zinc-ribbon domain-containing protein [Candidatus Bathyarchaeota archaeon]